MKRTKGILVQHPTHFCSVFSVVHVGVYTLSFPAQAADGGGRDGCQRDALVRGRSFNLQKILCALWRSRWQGTSHSICYLKQASIFLFYVNAYVMFLD